MLGFIPIGGSSDRFEYCPDCGRYDQQTVERHCEEVRPQGSKMLWAQGDPAYREQTALCGDGRYDQNPQGRWSDIRFIADKAQP